jgi:microcystin-dependent protein
MSSNQNLYPYPPDFDTWLKVMFRNLSAGLNCHTVGTVESFNPTNQTVTVSINYLRVSLNANPDPSSLSSTTVGALTNTVVPYPVLIQCPVVILQGGGAYITFPIAKGDTCVVLFNDREISTWLNNGGVSAPQNQRVHDLSDGIALIGIRPVINAIPNYNTSVIVIADSTGNRLQQSGFFQPCGLTVLPSGWLWCDGTSYLRTDYPTLFTAIGTAYGSADGDHFNVPMFNGLFLRGTDNGSGNDPDAGSRTALAPGGNTGDNVGSYEADEIVAHGHTVVAMFNPGSGAAGSGGSGGNSDLSTSTTGGSETRPKNVYVNWIVKI